MWFFSLNYNDLTQTMCAPSRFALRPAPRLSRGMRGTSMLQIDNSHPTSPTRGAELSWRCNPVLGKIGGSFRNNSWKNLADGTRLRAPEIGL
ncbi:MAG: hypothetical protein EAZ24_14680 [Burkholderiales bacterium]|nr:MAG: hypothetical protein EAZ24_14680 [Burkholderiales bacterium]